MPAVEEGAMYLKLSHRFLAALAWIGAAAVVLLTSAPAEAVPSFARQTGMACEACHTVFPELTPFGRRFKLNGYTLTTKQQISDINEKKQGTLSLADLPPLSIMAQVTSTWSQKALTDAGNPTGSKSDNGTVEFPQQLSLFYAGKIADNFGAFFQITYQQTKDHFSIDNSDIRYADHTEENDLVYGLTLNNNPTVQDVWNSTPAWGYPTAAPPSSVVVASAASPLIQNLGANVGGLGAYAFYKDSIYVEGSVYRAAMTGTNSAPLNTLAGAHVTGTAPYWRLAYETQWGKNNIELGTFGMNADYTRGGNGGGNGIAGSDNYTDLALDGQYQYIGEDHIFSASASVIRENQNLKSSYNTGAASHPTDDLTQYKVTGSYFYQRKFGGSLIFTQIEGSTDALKYPASGSSPSGANSPNTTSETLELDYLPFLNTKLFVQGTVYQKFNGSSGAYDGSITSANVSGRKASDNNTLYVGLWTNF